MNFAQTALLGAVAGFTIFIGLPVGRLPRVGVRVRVGLAMFSLGILAFIFVDVSRHAQDIVDTALSAFHHGHASFGHVVALFALLAAGFTLGTAGIATADQELRRRAARLRGLPISGGDAGGGVISAEHSALEAPAHALRSAMTVAVAIGLHNFAEGLAIGVSARAGAIGLATVLIIGFALHNATEGFGIVGPLGSERPSWRWLGLVGLVGGGPTFLGTIVGYQFHSNVLELCFYAIAGGAIIYVIGEIWAGIRHHGHRTFGLYLLAAGFLAGVATDLVVSYGGA